MKDGSKQERAYSIRCYENIVMNGNYIYYNESSSIYNRERGESEEKENPTLYKVSLTDYEKTAIVVAEPRYSFVVDGDYIYYFEFVDELGSGIIYPDFRVQTPYWVINTRG